MVCCRGSSRTQVMAMTDEDDTPEIDGPLSKRSCTDVPFLLFFLTFLGGMGYVGYLGFLTGDPYRLVYGVDSWGNTCNRPNIDIENSSMSGRDLTGLKYQFQFNSLAILTNLVDTTKVCVKTCPNETLETVEDMRNFHDRTGSNLCRYDITPDEYVNGTSDSDVCPTLDIDPTFPILSYCIPAVAMDLGSALLDSVSSLQGVASSVGFQPTCENAQGLFTNVSNDLTKSWQVILYLFAISVGVALVVTLLMRFFAAVMIWALVVGFALGCLGAAGYCWYTWFIYNTLLKDIPEADQSEADQKLVRNWLIYSCVVSVVGLIIILILLVMRKRIKLVVQLFREAGKAVAKMPLLLLQPVWTMLTIVVFIGGLVFVYMYVLTAGQPISDDKGHVTYEPGTLLFYMRWYYLLGMLWVAQFFYAGQQLVIAGAVAKWYFTRDKKHLGSPIASATKRLICYHLGSVALGSFIIAVIQLIRLILMFVQNRLKGNNKSIKFILKCMQCLMCCLEKIMKYINKNAYIMIAIYGTNFCRSAQKAFGVIVSNVLRVGAINSVGTFCLFLGKCGVVSIVIVIGLELLKTTELCYVYVPLGIAGIFAFAVAHCFLAVYGMAIDTIFMCFCEDCNRNDGVKHPYYMNKGLMEFVDNSREAIAAHEAREADLRNNPEIKSHMSW